MDSGGHWLKWKVESNIRDVTVQGQREQEESTKQPNMTKQPNVTKQPDETNIQKKTENIENQGMTQKDCPKRQIEKPKMLIEEI